MLEIFQSYALITMYKDILYLQAKHNVLYSADM